jgi:hypothetical protein
VHEADEPNAVIDLLDAEFLVGQNDGDVDPLSMQAEASERNLCEVHTGWCRDVRLMVAAGNKSSSSSLGVKSREDVMDQITRCQKCGKRMNPVVTISGRTDLQCISCDDPAVKWAESPLTAPEQSIATEHV